MGDVVTMTGAELMTPERLLDKLQARDDIQSFVVVLQRHDDINEVLWTRMKINEMAVAVLHLQGVTQPIIMQAVEDTQ